MKKRIIKTIVVFLIVMCICIPFSLNAYATDITDSTDLSALDNSSSSSDASDNDSLFGIDISTSGESGGISGALQIVVVLTILALCPSILIMLTSFTRILIVMHFTRAALNTQSAPPNQILVGISLFLTIFIMSPVFNQIYQNAYVPLNNNEITQEEALDAAIKPLRTFMLKNISDKADLDKMCEIAGMTQVENTDDIPIYVVIPAFILNELKIAFWIGFLIYIPFIVIDMVVSSTLMSMGMMMLPPTTISMPFKILLFVLADGWNLIIVNLLQTIKV
jgi:flagellar biosynthetic protein FliP